MVIYDVGLSSVESPSDTKNPYGSYDTIRISNQQTFKNNKNAQITDKYRYTDKYIDIIWWYSTTQFKFELTNRSAYTIKINWDDITYVDYTGNISRIMHKGVKYVDCEKNQGSINIPKDGRLNDIIVPTSNVYFNQKFEQQPLIPCYYKTQQAMENDIINKTWIGKKVHILFPFEIEGTKNDYTFEFTVNGILNQLTSQKR